MDGTDASLDIVENPQDYDSWYTQALIMTFIENCDVDVIFVAVPDKLGFTNSDLRQYSWIDKDYLNHDASGGHNDHFHVRIKKP